MRTYLIVTCATFTLLAFVHVLRLVLEGSEPLADPWFVGATALSLSLAGWGWWLLRQGTPAQSTP